MDNYAIADQLSMLAKLMDIHGENSFKAKSYSVAAFTIEKLPQEIAGLSPEKISAIKGIGDSAGKKIVEILEQGELQLLKEYISKTPEGVLEMMNIKGVNYTELIPIMIKAMQELSKQNDDLKNQVSTLTATVSQLTKSNGVVSASTASINQNFPNPFTKSTVISFNVPQGSNANIVVSQTGSGKVIKTIPLSAGTSQLTFDGASLAAGSYSYSLYIDGKKIDSKQMVINR